MKTWFLGVYVFLFCPKHRFGYSFEPHRRQNLCFETTKKKKKKKKKREKKKKKKKKKKKQKNRLSFSSWI